jgi:O-antigen/teichoic acid export membrane protein
VYYDPLSEVNNSTPLYKRLVYSNLKRLLQLSVDSELREVLKTSLPLVLVELVSSLYSLTDTYFVSGLGAEALAGLGISMYVLMFLQSAIVLFTTPILIVVSQSLGAGRLDFAIWKGFKELYNYGLIRKLPKMVEVQAEGARFL